MTQRTRSMTMDILLKQQSKALNKFMSGMFLNAAATKGTSE